MTHLELKSQFECVNNQFRHQTQDSNQHSLPSFSYLRFLIHVSRFIARNKPDSTVAFYYIAVRTNF